MKKTSFPDLYDVAGLPHLLNNVGSKRAVGVEKPQKLTFYLATELAERLDSVARAKAMSKSAFVAELVEKELTREEAIEIERRMKRIMEEK